MRDLFTFSLLAFWVGVLLNFNDSHRKLLEEHGGTALPFAVFMDGNGKVMNRFRGMYSAKARRKVIDHLKLFSKKANATPAFHHSG